MPVPKRKTSKSRRDKRSAGKFIRPKAFNMCSQCAEPITPHTVCASCGYYKGKKIMRTKLDRAIERGERKGTPVQASEATSVPVTEESE